MKTVALPWEDGSSTVQYLSTLPITLRKHELDARFSKRIHIMQINRRRFLLSGSALASCAFSLPVGAVPVQEPKTWNASYDVVVVGAGAAGLSAACEAVKRKLSVCVLEKVGVVGGSSAICGGQWSVSGTREQKERGIQDSEELFVKDMLKTGQNQNDPELVKVFVRNSKAMYDWVTTDLRLRPATVTLAAGMSVPRAHTFKPAEIIMALKDWAEKRGAEIRESAPVERLLWDNRERRICGVKALVDGKERFIEAKKGVILAAGGFSRSPKLLKKYAPLLENAGVIAGVGTQGDGILMAQAYGADLVDTPYIKASYGFSLHATTIKDMSLIYYKGAVMVNKAGKRFVNESISYKLLADRSFAQPEGRSWLVFDNAIRKVAMKADPFQDGVLWKPIDEGKVPDYVFEGATLEEAAKKAGLPPEAVAATVKKYNEAIDKGGDEMGRTSLSSGYGKPVKIEHGPFFVFPATGAMIGTYCGVKITPQAQVSDVFGVPIRNLYAAGEMTGGVHGAAYMTGTAFGKALAFGKVAADSIADRA